MAKTRTTCRLVRPDESSTQRSFPIEEEIEETRLKNFKDMYHEAEVEARQVRDRVASTSEGEIEENDESNGDKEMGSAFDPKALYNNDLREEISLDQGVYAPSHPEDQTGIDFGDLVNFKAQEEEKARAIKKRYPFRRGYALTLLGVKDRAHLPPEDTMAVSVK